MFWLGSEHEIRQNDLTPHLPYFVSPNQPKSLISHFTPFTHRSCPLPFVTIPSTSHISTTETSAPSPAASSPIKTTASSPTPAPADPKAPQAAPKTPHDGSAYPTPQPTVETAPQATVAAATVQADKPAEQPQAEPADKVEEPPPPKEDPYANKFAKLVVKEKRLTEQQRLLKTERDAVERDKQQLALAHKEVQNFYQARQYAKQKPLAALKALGLDWNETLQYSLQHVDDIPKAADHVDSRLAQAEAKIAAYEQNEARKQREQAAYTEQENLNRYKADLTTHLKAKSEYEFINLQGAYDDVFDVVVRHLDKTGEVMDRDKAARLVENYLSAQFGKIETARRHKANSSISEAPSSAPAISASERTIVSAIQAGAQNYAPTRYIPSRAEDEAALIARAKQLGWTRKRS